MVAAALAIVAVLGFLVPAAIEEPEPADAWQYTTGWYTDTIYFTRAETARLKTRAGAVAVFGAVCATQTRLHLQAACVSTFLLAGLVTVYADDYYSEGNCIKLKVPTLQFGRVQRGTRNCR